MGGQIEKINHDDFLVNCPFGKMFMESIDASSFLKTREKTFRASLGEFLKT